MRKIKMLNFQSLDSEEDRQKATEVITNGLQSPFWNYLKQVLEYNIEKLKEEILSKIEMTQEDCKNSKRYLVALQELVEAPKKHLIFLKSVENIKEKDEITSENGF